MAVTETVFAFDTISAGNPSYNAADELDWMWQWMNRRNGVFLALDSSLAVTADGVGNVLTQNGVCALNGRTYKLAGGPQTTALTPLPASGFRTAYAVVVRFTAASATGTVVTIAGSTIANPGPAVNPSIVSATDVLLAYVLAVNTAGTIAYTVTDARYGVGILPVTTGSPITLTAWAVDGLDINATTNPFIVNLPQASTCTGEVLRLVNSSTASTGLVKIVPFSGDRIGPMGNNVAAYLSNYDQSGWFNTKQALTIMSDGTNWVVLSGQFMPEPGSVDAAGSQYFLGKLRHLPLGNTTSRLAANHQPTVTGWSSAFQVTGSFGVPSGAKAVRARIRIGLNPNAANTNSTLAVSFSDNTSSTPGFDTAQPGAELQVTNGTSTSTSSITSELDIPLNSLGRFYIYTWDLTNITSGQAQVIVSIVGYYMGD